MKVTGLRTMVVEAEEPYIGGKYFLFLELQTDEGITGIGERIAGSSYSDHLGDLKSQVSLIEEFVGQFVIGENPLNIERIWDRMYGDAPRPAPPQPLRHARDQRHRHGPVGHRRQGRQPADLQPARRPLSRDSCVRTPTCPPPASTSIRRRPAMSPPNSWPRVTRPARSSPSRRPTPSATSRSGRSSARARSSRASARPSETGWRSASGRTARCPPTAPSASRSTWSRTTRSGSRSP